MSCKIGTIKPGNRPGKPDEVMDLPPSGQFELLFDNLNIHHGTPREMVEAIDPFTPKVADRAKKGVDLIRPAGAPPRFMIS